MRAQDGDRERLEQLGHLDPRGGYRLSRTYRTDDVGESVQTYRGVPFLATWPLHASPRHAFEQAPGHQDHGFTPLDARKCDDFVAMGSGYFERTVKAVRKQVRALRSQCNETGCERKFEAPVHPILRERGPIRLIANRMLERGAGSEIDWPAVVRVDKREIP